MKTIIAGTCDAPQPDRMVALAIEKRCGWGIDEIVHRGNGNIDMAAGRYGHAHDIPVEVFPADREAHGKAAGPKRNNEMAQYADALIAIWDGESSGTMNMINAACRYATTTLALYYAGGFDD